MKNKALKAALLSGLVFPGMGHIYLKHHKRGIALILSVSVCMVVIVIKAVQKALIILDQIMMKGGAVNIITIREASTEALRVSDDPVFQITLLLILLLWIVGIFDTYRIGRNEQPGEEAGR